MHVNKQVTKTSTVNDYEREVNYAVNEPHNIADDNKFTEQFHIGIFLPWFSMSERNGTLTIRRWKQFKAKTLDLKIFGWNLELVLYCRRKLVMFRIPSISLFGFRYNIDTTTTLTNLTPKSVWGPISISVT